jgi:hypothetical protein
MRHEPKLRNNVSTFFLLFKVICKLLNIRVSRVSQSSACSTAAQIEPRPSTTKQHRGNRDDEVRMYEQGTILDDTTLGANVHGKMLQR